MFFRSPVTIDLIRNLDDNSKDDTIRITYHDDTTIAVNYMDKQGRANPIRHTLYITNTPLGTYMNDLVTLLVNDNEPFESAQFNFPGFPSVLYTQKKLKRDYQLRDSLRSVANMVSDSWYSHLTTPDAPLRDCDDCEYCDCSNE